MSVPTLRAYLYGLTGFVRELPLTWNGRTCRFDLASPPWRTILARAPRLRLTLATWSKVTERPHGLVHELAATMAA